MISLDFCVKRGKIFKLYIFYIWALIFLSYSMLTSSDFFHLTFWHLHTQLFLVHMQVKWMGLTELFLLLKVSSNGRKNRVIESNVKCRYLKGFL
jgi:hypothetical protein